MYSRFKNLTFLTILSIFQLFFYLLLNEDDICKITTANIKNAGKEKNKPVYLTNEACLTSRLGRVISSSRFLSQLKKILLYFLYQG